MTYKIISNQVIRIADNKLIAPCQSADDPDFVAYKAWVEDGNTPEYAEELSVENELITINQFQMQSALALNGLTNTVAEIINSISDETQRTLLKIAFTTHQNIQSDNIHVNNILQAAGLDADERYALFQQASLIAI